MKLDKLLSASLGLIALGYVLASSGEFFNSIYVKNYSMGIYDLVHTIWWGILLSIFVSGLIGNIPRELVMAILGRPGGIKGVLRATVAGVLLDLCNHGILLIGMRLYERGASIGQTMAFLIASPWNSLSLTFILVSLIGLKWTLAFILLSMLVGILTGWIFDLLVAQKKLPANPNAIEISDSYNMGAGFKDLFKQVSPNPVVWFKVFIKGFVESRSILRWVMLGIVLTAGLRSLLTVDQFQEYFGPSMLGITVTLFFASILEVCSEGGTPIAADILNTAKAPGNAFTFLMAGVCSDYTEILAIKETTKSWRLALFLPLISVPQILVIAWLMNT